MDVQNSFNIKLSIGEKDELYELLKKLVMIKTENPPGNEKEIALFIKDYFANEGVKADLIDIDKGRTNVIVQLKGGMSGPKYLLNGHLDVVPAGEGWETSPFNPIIHDGKLYGRGTADMKSGVAAMIYATKYVNKHLEEFPGELILFLNADEERRNDGMEDMISNPVYSKYELDKADFGVIGEPTDGKVCIGHRGVAKFRITTRGIPRHASEPNKGKNAIYEMNQIIGSLESLSQRVNQKKDQVLGSASLAVTLINGGSAPNIIPEKCEIEIDRRILPSENLDDIHDEIHKFLVSESGSAELQNYYVLDASYIEPTHSLVAHLKTAYYNATNEQTTYGVFNATCEAPYLSKKLGIPTVIFGPGSLEQAHTNNEFVELSEVNEVALTYINLLMNTKNNTEEKYG
ncbi:M20 family metallopeptidase [Salicibibacter cibarius]|uniref:M20 family metallopeptidase n=1 Tax=Salicibibacter cibarius TaxID=2743000 RepID=A0A7T6Z4G4_9BACI|nr:M20 family metallopeptidase [Salicibibacter cibarius]QQK76656.1 M20 family metallopeptidase [Salicibibacter cibarius]